MSETQPRSGREKGLSIIGGDLTVIGELRTDGVVKIDGVVEGNIRAQQQLLVSKDGAVKGDIQTREAIVGGTVTGSIQADERVEVQSTATVHGDITTKRILVHEGGEVNGNIHMGDLQSSRRGTPVAPRVGEHSVA
ncbi:MAG: polymer-forming cytoskeletal protein [Gemmatimonadales bacterium]